MDNSELLNKVEEKLKSQFPDDLLSSELLVDYPTFIIKRDAIEAVVGFLYHDAGTEFQYLTTMAGLHYPDNKGQEFGVMYQLHNLSNNWRIRLKIFFGKSDLSVPSITSVFPAANWMERQEFDFFGIDFFLGHPNLQRILNMDEMDYHPMRKEYALEDATREDKDDKMFGR